MNTKTPEDGQTIQAKNYRKSNILEKHNPWAKNIVRHKSMGPRRYTKNPKLSQTNSSKKLPIIDHST